MSADADSAANGVAAAKFVATIFDEPLPDEVILQAKKCLVDWCAVALGAHEEEAAKQVRRVVETWQSKGDAVVLLGGKTSPVVSAMINGTLAHCLDFDDTHVASVGHFSGPTWAAVLALGTTRRAREIDLLTAFTAGFEVGGRLGGKNFGVLSNAKGWHSTGVFGCLAAAGAASAVMRLSAEEVLLALGAAATQASGLTASFGTMAKPLHAGKAAFNGVFAAELAATGFESARDLLEPGKGLGAAIIQDASQTTPRFDAAGGWEILQNTFKPYACCLLTHATVDAARALSARVAGRRVERVTARVNPLAVQLAGKPTPATPLEAKFSTAYCAAIGLAGYSASQADFSAELLRDPRVQDLMGRTEVAASPEFDRTSAAMQVTLAGGEILEQRIALAKGNPGNPMNWDDLWAKFSALVEPVMGRRTEELFDVLRHFEKGGQRDRFVGLVERPGRG